MYFRADEPQPKFPEINHHKKYQKLVSRPTGLLTFHSPEKIQMYMICEGIGSAVWLMSHVPLWAAYLATALAKVAASQQEGSPAQKSCLPTSPGHHSLPRTSARLGDIAGSWLQNHASNIRFCCWEDESMGTGCSCHGRKGRAWAGWEGLVLADSFSASAQELLPQELGPFWGPNCLFGNQHAAHTQIQKCCFQLSFVIDLKPWSSHPRQSASLSELLVPSRWLPPKRNENFKRNNTGRDKDNWKRSNSTSKLQITFLQQRPRCLWTLGMHWR